MRKKRSSLPTVSVVVATYNSHRTIGRCLASVRSQVYPQEKIEIILVDGGSIDRTREIANNYRVRWIAVDPQKQNAEYNKSLGVAKAKGEILFLLDHDNIIPHRRWLRGLVQPFIDHPEVVGVETLRYHYDPTASLIDRYFALFGAGDPLAWYLGKADRLSFMFDTYHLMGKATDVGDYYLVQFDPEHIPTLGANGFLIRHKLLMREAQIAPDRFFHIDVNVDLIRKGYNTYAFVKDSILHLTGYSNVINFLRRRLLFMEQYHLSKTSIGRQGFRRYSVFERKDTGKLIWFIFISLTLVIPLFDSLRGYRKIHDRAWFLHPLLCFTMVILYGWVIIRHQIRIYVHKFLEK